MIIFFTDGELINDVCQSAANEVERNDIDMVFYIDAGEGPTKCYAQLDAAKEFDKNYKVLVLTNFLGALSGTYSWNDFLGIHNILFPIKGRWSLVQNFTERELRRAHNIGKMYVAGSFDYNPKESGFDNDL